MNIYIICEEVYIYELLLAVVWYIPTCLVVFGFSVANNITKNLVLRVH